MKKTILVITSICVLCVTLALLIFIPAVVVKFKTTSNNTVLMLLPDLNTDPTLIQAWKNTAIKEGVNLELLTDNEFLLPVYQQHIKVKGIILPDTLHTRMSSSLARNLTSYVNSGGHLMLIYDAGTENLRGHPYKNGSLFSSMLHFQYGAVTQTGEAGIKTSHVGHSKMSLYQIGIPPENCVIDEESNITIPNDLFCALSSHEYGPLTYQHFITKPIKKDIPLILTTTDHQFIAGLRPFGKGQILFVNLPLTYLSLGKDDMPMRIFFRHFAIDILGLPSLNT